MGRGWIPAFAGMKGRGQERREGMDSRLRRNDGAGAVMTGRRQSCLVSVNKFPPPALRLQISSISHPGIAVSIKDLTGDKTHARDHQH